MQTFKWILALLLIAITLHALGQSRTGSRGQKSTSATTTDQPAQHDKISATTDKLNSTSKNINKSDTALRKAAKTAGNSLNDIRDIFKSKKANTVTISIANIDYDDENLALLKADIKNVKGVKSVETKYKSGAALLEVSFKGPPSDLWDRVSKNVKQLFKLIESDDTNLILSYKNAKSNSSALPEKNNSSQQLSAVAALMFKNVISKLTDAQKNAIADSMGFPLSKNKQQFIMSADDNDYPFDEVVYPTDLNKDGAEEIFVIWGNTFTSGVAGSSVNLFIKNKSGQYISNFGFPGCCVSTLTTNNHGYPDLLIGGPGMQFPVWRWDGKGYTFYKEIKDEEMGRIKTTDITDLSKEYCSNIK